MAKGLRPISSRGGRRKPGTEVDLRRIDRWNVLGHQANREVRDEWTPLIEDQDGERVDPFSIAYSAEYGRCDEVDPDTLHIISNQ